jgi:FkbH-like protein
VIGQCTLAGWGGEIERQVPGTKTDGVLFNHAAQLPENPPHPASEYDFQLIQIPMRSVLPESEFFRLSYDDPAAYERLFADTKERLFRYLAEAMRWNRSHGILSFVCNYLVPMQNPMGRLLPRYDLRNMVYFVEKLNESLGNELQRYRNAYLFDADQVMATFGRRFVQDDAVWITNHGAGLTDGDWEADQDRLEKPHKASELFLMRLYESLKASCAELLGLYRTVRQVDMVKLVVFDIDDTLWRGVAAESMDDVRAETMEGWPLGIAEAIGHLKRRGVLVAIISKNDESKVEKLWKARFGRRLLLEDFVSRKINWRTKVENLEEILQETNLLPGNVLFVDDNPVERASIQAAFPAVRAIGPEPLLWRRILLWSPETQVAAISAESTARTAMVQAQVERETQRKHMSREEFLASLNVQLDLLEITTTEHPRFKRALELINKSNQYNTTGIRWSEQQCQAAFAEGTSFFAFEVKDRFTPYGLVGVVVVKGTHVGQFVMSCRVVGMGVELAALATIFDIVRARHPGAEPITASLEHTPANTLAQDLWSRCGFKEHAGLWQSGDLPACPAHVQITSRPAAAANEVREPLVAVA